MLEIRSLRKTFGELTAVDDLSLKVSPGEIYGLLGPNGAGKTTTLSIVCGLVRQDSGTVTIDGKNIETEPVLVKSVMGFVPQEVALYDELSALENLRFWGKLYGLSGSELDQRISEVLTRVGLHDRAGDILEKFSGGMKRRINLAVALLHRPRLLLLDEPTVGIDPQARVNILEVVREIAAAGTGILYTTHYMEEAETLCDRIGIMDQGKLLAEGTLKELVSMLGEGKIVTLRGRFTEEQIEGPLRVRSDVRIITREPEYCLFLSTEPERITEVIKSLFDEGVPVGDISVRDPSLESLFIKLTGKELRD
jgi:ABC-2 type transport system ATP-binding protein